MEHPEVMAEEYEFLRRNNRHEHVDVVQIAVRVYSSRCLSELREGGDGGTAGDIPLRKTKRAETV